MMEIIVNNFLKYNIATSPQGEVNPPSFLCLQKLLPKKLQNQYSRKLPYQI